MASIVNALIEFTAAHPHMVGLVAFFAALLESVAIVGAPVPGTAALIGIGALASSDGTVIVSVVLWAIAGAIAGDALSYNLGRRYHGQIRQWRPFRQNPKILARGEAFLHRHGGKSVFLGRFVPGLRTLVPLVAGMAEMPPGRFYVANVSGGIIWAPLTILPGALFGVALSLTAAVSVRLAVLASILLALVILTAWSMRILARRGIPAVTRLLDNSLTWTERGEGRVRRLLYAGIRAMHEAPLTTLLGAISLIATVAFLTILEDVVTGDPLVRIDAATFDFLQALRTSWADHIMVVITMLGDGEVVTVVTMAVLASLIWQRAWRSAVYWALAMATAALFAAGVKAILRLPRPIDLTDSFAFPSGHTTRNAVLYGFLVVLALSGMKGRRRIPIVVLASLMIAGIGFSRLYLGAHWLSDVLGGLTFALAWVTLLAATYLRRADPPVRIPALMGVAALTLVVFGSWHVTQRFDADLERYAVRRQEEIVPAADWWSDGWRSQPAVRAELTGEAEEPLNLQWAGDLASLTQQLSSAGWRMPTPWSASAALSFLSPEARPLDLPVLPKLHDGRSPALTRVLFVEGEPAARFVLRLWPSETDLQTATGALQPLWLGSVRKEHEERFLALLSWMETTSDMRLPLSELVGDVSFLRLVRRPPSIAPDLGWDGTLVLGYAGALSLESGDRSLESRDHRASTDIHHRCLLDLTDRHKAAQFVAAATERTIC